ncbi:hypothetical protein CSKR_203719 [Clonorchis sinensis]|uniref:Fibronectin type-III domain-containing protein n=1 Tax=Clonorchis sinensis TaxID=79923 RepID=A0A8T1N0K6_CLOSI|nr:hypothetical protein CSKR_203719 [Clonorchis sinensis]
MKTGDETYGKRDTESNARKCHQVFPNFIQFVEPTLTNNDSTYGTFPSNLVSEAQSEVLGELENVGVDVRVNDPTVTVSWVYTGNCTSPEFLMVVYKSGNTIVKSVSTHDSRNVLSELPLCTSLVVAITPSVPNLKSSKAALSSTFVIPSDFYPASNIQVEMDPEGGVFTATWLPATTCDPVGYEVSVFDQSGTRIYLAEADSPPVQFDYLQECGTLSLKVKSVGTGWSNDDAEVQHFKLIPSPPKHILVEPIVSTSNAIVSWTFDHICGATEFTVNTYTAGNIVVGTYSTRDRSLVLTRLQGCVSLVLGIMATNDLGSTLETRSAPFSLRILLAPPKNVQVETVTNTSSVSVSWEHEDVCPSPEFIITVFQKDRNVIYREYTSVRQLIISGLPACVPLQLGVATIGGSIDSQQTLSKSFYVLAVPNEAQNIQINIITKISGVAVTWTYKDDCDLYEFFVSVYTQNGLMVKQVETYENSAEISGLPKCKPLTVGVVASNHLGRGPEKNSTVFNIPEAKESSDSVMVIKLNATGNIRRFSSANSLDDAVARKSICILNCREGRPPLSGGKDSEFVPCQSELPVQLTTTITTTASTQPETGDMEQDGLEPDDTEMRDMSVESDEERDILWRGDYGALPGRVAVQEQLETNIWTIQQRNISLSRG